MRGLKLAVVSSSRNASPVLEAAHIADHFPVVVVEDAVSGVRAGSAGNFHSVIGVDREGGATGLLEACAALVVNDLNELL